MPKIALFRNGLELHRHSRSMSNKFHFCCPPHPELMNDCFLSMYLYYCIMTFSREPTTNPGFDLTAPSRIPAYLGRWGTIALCTPPTLSSFGVGRQPRRHSILLHFVCNGFLTNDKDVSHSAACVAPPSKRQTCEHQVPCCCALPPAEACYGKGSTCFFKDSCVDEVDTSTQTLMLQNAECATPKAYVDHESISYHYAAMCYLALSQHAPTGPVERFYDHVTISSTIRVGLSLLTFSRAPGPPLCLGLGVTSSSNRDLGTFADACVHASVYVFYLFNPALPRCSGVFPL